MLVPMFRVLDQLADQTRHTGNSQNTLTPMLMRSNVFSTFRSACNNSNGGYAPRGVLDLDELHRLIPSLRTQRSALG